MHDSKEVFLVSGQRTSESSGELSGAIEQRVVQASNNVVAYAMLAKQEPGFKPLGFASLADYDDAASKIRATLRGEATGWPFIEAVV